jgi:hypothetical protein
VICRPTAPPIPATLESPARIPENPEAPIPENPTAALQAAAGPAARATPGRGDAEPVGQLK